MVQRRAFRADLFYRLNVFPILDFREIVRSAIEQFREELKPDQAVARLPGKPIAARSVLWRARIAAPPTGFQLWAHSTQQRRGHNIAAVAVANKLARIAWAVWSKQRPFNADRPVPDCDGCDGTAD